MAGTIKKAAQAVANALPTVTSGQKGSPSTSNSKSNSSSSSRPTEISLPASTPFIGNTTGGSGKTPRTPRTPADEAIAYFSAEGQQQEEVQIWELPLEDDGGPNDARSVSLARFELDVRCNRSMWIWVWMADERFACVFCDFSTSGYLPRRPRIS
jgi:hypothetical protein